MYVSTSFRQSLLFLSHFFSKIFCFNIFFFFGRKWYMSAANVVDSNMLIRIFWTISGSFSFFNINGAIMFVLDVFIMDFAEIIEFKYDISRNMSTKMLKNKWYKTKGIGQYIVLVRSSDSIHFIENKQTIDLDVHCFNLPFSV